MHLFQNLSPGCNLFFVPTELSEIQNGYIQRFLCGTSFEELFGEKGYQNWDQSFSPGDLLTSAILEKLQNSTMSSSG